MYYRWKGWWIKYIKFYNFKDVTKHDYNCDSIYLDNFGFYDSKINLFNILLYSSSSKDDAKLTLSSIATTTKSELYNIVNGDNLFNKIFINYKSIHDDEFKRNIINLIGIKIFASEYENLFEGSKEYNRYINLESLMENL